MTGTGRPIPPALRLPAVTGLGCLAVGLVAWAVPVTIGSLLARVVVVGVVVLGTACVLLVTAAYARADRPEAAAHALVAGTAVLLAGSAVLALDGTAWGFGGLWSDASFRTQAATRYADDASLADYAYADLPAYYPPALAWTQGRVAALLGSPAWAVLKPAQVLVCALVPLLAFWLWRRVLPALPAAAVAAATAVATADPMKPDEWLVLVCLVPWWVELVRGARDDDARPWPWWLHGVFAGVVLLVHTYYVLPLAVATLLGWAADLARRRRPELGVVRALGVVAVGLVVAAPYWVPMVLPRLTGSPSDVLQLRFSYPGAHEPPWPLPVDGPGALGAVGLVWLAWSLREARRSRGDRLAGGLALVWAAGLLVLLAGAVGARHDVGFLAFKSDEVVILAMTAAGVCGWWAAGVALARRRARWRAGLGLVAGAAAIALTAQWAGYWVVGLPAHNARTTPYADGSTPVGGAGLEPEDLPAWYLPGDPSVDQVRETWRELTGGPLDSSDVLVTSRVDLLATTPVHLFVTWKSIYSHPLGRFEDRVDLLAGTAGCGDSACAHDLLTGNPYDAVDGLVLERRGDELLLPILLDDFPERSRTTAVRFPAEVFDGPGFATAEVGRLVVIAVDRDGGSLDRATRPAAG